MRQRIATVQPAPRDMSTLLAQRAELLTELGLHPDYHQHADVLGRVVELRLGLPLAAVPVVPVAPSAASQP